MVDISVGLGLLLAVKDETELDLVKKSSVLGNKILKRGFVPKLEEVIENEKNVTHEALAEEIEEIFSDPKKIKLNVQPDDVQSAYFPIVQSGGDYDLRVSAVSNNKKMKFDIITISLGSRYQNYCSNVARTFLVDPPKAVSDTYETLIDVHEACLAVMKPGNTLKSVYAAAVKQLKKSDREDLVECLPKNLGFAIGVYFREGNLTLSKKNNVTFKPGMTFNLCIGFSGVKLGDSDKSAVNEKSAVSSTHERIMIVFDAIS
jgi:nucleosome binding factor SPN SPT16 subunit